MKEGYQRGSFLSGVAWLGASKGITQIGTWIATVIIARLLTPADYGLVGMSGLLVGVITLVGDLGLNVSIIQKKNVSHQEISALFWQFILIDTALACLLYFLAPVGARFWGEPELINLIRLSALVFFINSFGLVPLAFLQKKMRFREYGIVLSLAAISGSIVTIILAYNGLGPYSLILGTLSVVIVKLVFAYLYEPFKPQFVFVTQETKMHLKFGTILTTGRYLSWYYSNCDFWLASKFLGKSAYGSYSMAYQLASLPIEKIASIINPVAFPAFSKIEDDTERGKFFFTILKYMAYISFPIFVGFYWTADDLIHVLLGEKWVNSVVAFKVFVLIFPLRCLDSLNSPLLNSIRRVDVGTKNMAIGAVLATFAFAVGVQYGINGLAYSWLVFYPFFFLICLYNVSRAAHFLLREYFSNFNRIVLNMVCMSLAIYLFQTLYNLYIVNYFTTYPAQILRLGGTILVGMISFVTFVFLVDRDIMKKIVKLFFTK